MLLGKYFKHNILYACLFLCWNAQRKRIWSEYYCFDEYLSKRGKVACGGPAEKQDKDKGE